VHAFVLRQTPREPQPLPQGLHRPTSRPGVGGGIAATPVEPPLGARDLAPDKSCTTAASDRSSSLRTALRAAASRFRAWESALHLIVFSPMCAVPAGSQQAASSCAHSGRTAPTTARSQHRPRAHPREWFAVARPSPQVLQYRKNVRSSDLLISHYRGAPHQLTILCTELRDGPFRELAHGRQVGYIRCLIGRLSTLHGFSPDSAPTRRLPHGRQYSHP
jgi:hypothetical protein